jgi:6-phosphogluconolactonase (cycloisomerase 2 family)
MAKIITKNSSTASAIPTTSDLVQGELAVNVTDKRIFTENASTQIVELGTNPSAITTATATVTGTLTANGTFASSNAVVTGGSVNSTPIGATTASTVRGTTVTATTGFVGGLTGNVTGNLTGNVTGNVTGDLTGNVTGNVTASSGTTTLNNLVVNGTADFTATKLVNVSTPTAGTDAANKDYVDTSVAAVIDAAPAALDTLNELAAALGDDANFSSTITTSIATKLPLAGGTMTGAIAMGTSKITGLGDPTAAQDAATKAYVDTQDATKLALAGGTMSGAIAMGTNKITGVGDPTLAQDAATKAYTDSILGSATSAADSAAAAATSASNASTSASNAASSATTASNAVTSAELAATNAAASYDSFDDRYLGAKASDPAVDNDGDALIEGATYFNSTTDAMKVYDGAAWSDVAPVATSVTLSQVTDFPSQSGQSGKYLTTNGSVPSWVEVETDPTKGTLTKTFTAGETADITLSGSVVAPVVSATKEVAQTGVTNNNWDAAAGSYELEDSAYDTSLSFVSEGYALSTASFVDSFSVALQDTAPESLAFNTDGTKMFVLGGTGDDVNEYTLSTGFDVSTSSFVDSFSVTGQETAPKGLAFNTDGTKMFIIGFANDTVYEYTLSTAFDISTATYSQNFSVASEEAIPSGITFNTDGTKMFIVGYGGDEVNEYALTTGFDVSTASFTQNFSVASQDTTPSDIAFNSNGTKMFIVGQVGQDINEYTLSTGFDVSTATYSQNFSVVSEESTPNGIAFNASGSKMFIVGSGGDDVNEYTMPLNEFLELGTGSFASTDVGKTINVNDGVLVLTATDGSYVETTAPSSTDTASSGEWSMFGVVYDASADVLEVSSIVDPATTFDISTASYSQSFSLSSQVASFQELAFNNDGTKMFACDFTNQDISEYALSTAFDVSTASYLQAFSVSSQETQPRSFTFSTDGTKMFVVGSAGDDVNEYTLSTGFDVSTASFVDSFSISAQEAVPTGVAFNTNGTKMFIVGSSGDDVNEYTLSTGFDVSTASYSQNFSVAAQDSSPFGIAFNTDGTKMFIVGDAGDDINQYSLSTGFDVSTASFVDSFSVSSQDTAPAGVAFNNDGTKMFVAGRGDTSVDEYSVGTASITTGYQPAISNNIDSTYWTDINSLTATNAIGDGNVFYAISNDNRDSWSILDNDNGVRDIVRDNAGTWQYNSNGTYGSETWTNATTNTEVSALREAMEGAETTTAYSLESASYSSLSFSVASQETQLRGVALNNDGTKMYVVGRGNDTVYQYSLSTAYDVSTASYDSVSLSVSAQETGPWNIDFNNDGTKMYILGTTSKEVFQYTLSTAFDLSTASYASISFDPTTQAGNASYFAFKADGTIMYVGDYIANVIYQYALSTAFDVSTASYSSISFAPSGQMSQSFSLKFNPTGTKAFILSNIDTVFQYSLSTAWDISTASYDSFSLNAGSEDLTPYSMHFGDNGTKLYISGDTNDSIYQYSTSSTSYTNQMDSTALNAITDANQITLGNDLDFAAILYIDSGTTVPTYSGTAINYDANVLNSGAILGTDYDFDYPASDKVRVTAVTAGNYKVRVV